MYRIVCSLKKKEIGDVTNEKKIHKWYGEKVVMSAAEQTNLRFVSIYNERMNVIILQCTYHGITVA